MKHSDGDRVFSDSIAQLYEQRLVPLIFEPYARDMARRLVSLRPSAVLEIAAGTGVVTRHLAAQLSADVTIVATDLNQPMLDQAQRVGTTRPVTWQQADAMALPFADGAFDAVVCQFGAMFFPDKAAAFAQARRVLRPGGTFLFNVWDRTEENAFAACVAETLAELFPTDPPRFLARLPHGYYEPTVIAADLARGGFTGPMVFDTITEQSTAESAREVAIAYCQGTPLRNEIEARDASILAKATERVTLAISQRFGEGQVTGKIQALVIAATRDQ